MTRSPTTPRRRRGSGSNRMRWRGAPSSEKLNAPAGVPASGPLPRVRLMASRLRGDLQRLAERAEEQVGLALGRPARDLHALARDQVQPDGSVVHLHVRAAHALVARAL